MRILWCVAASLVFTCFLYASTTHNQTALQHYIVHKQSGAVTAYAGLWPAAKYGSREAMETLSKLAEQNADVYWLERAASLNSLPAQLALANIDDSAKRRRFWLTQAASNNHAPSQFALYLTTKNSKKRIHYLQSSARNFYAPAIVALAEYLYEEGSLEASLEWLELAAEMNDASRFMLARVQWQLGDVKSATTNFTLAGNTFALAQEYAEVIKNYSERNMSSLLQPNAESAKIEKGCAQQYQFIATSLESAVQAYQFSQKFSQDKRFTDFPICINPIAWIKSDQLVCELVNHRQQCDLAPLAKQIHSPNYTHLVLFLKTGKAYVQHGLMYLDQADSYAVFVHEMAHFVGFVDEYSVSRALAADYCEHGQAPNLLLALNAEDSIYSSSKFNEWLALSRELIANQDENENEDEDEGDQLLVQEGLHYGTSDTCANLNISAYKPSEDITFLEHHDTNNIPDIYLLMWRKLLEQQYQNVAVAQTFYRIAIKQETSEAANYWFELVKAS